ncbi:clc-like domain-containing protein [Ditylenchus destructor]|nr:clc-like domain-containing protein [Ditylenchus destructor]
MGRKAVGVARLSLIVVSVIFASISLLITIIAVATPAWQTVFLAEFQTEHLHGLWLDCTLTRRHLQAYSGSSTDMHCTYKFENADLYPDSSSTVHSEEEQHKFQEWHKAAFTFFLIAVTCSTTALCFTLCAACVRLCAIAACVLNVCAFLTSFVALSVFFFNSHRTEIRFVHGITMTYEQSKGYSFYMAIAGVFGFLLTFIVGLLATIFVFLHDKNQHRPLATSNSVSKQQQRKTFPKENDNQIATIASIAV